MYAYISAKNSSQSPVISVYVNDRLYFSDVTHESGKRLCPAGSIQITVFDNREKLMHDLYLPVNPRQSYLLEVLSAGYNFTPLGFF